METIRNYLETMFVHLPNTEEVKKAKHELYQMMEDKYNELLADGKTENEATGIVIAEFGNLDELAETLGIDSYVKSGSYVKGEGLSLTTVKEFLHDSSKHAFGVALGVFLLIICAVPAIVMDGIAEAFPQLEDALEAVGIIGLLVILVLGIAVLVFSGIKIDKWKYLKNGNYYLDFSTTKYVGDQQSQYRTTYAVLLTVGIALCVLCAVPAIALDAISSHAGMWSEFFENLSGAAVLAIVGVGVFMIILSSTKMDTYHKLLKLNGADSIGGHYDNSQDDVYYENNTIRAIMSVYWPSITCIYLIWSFLSFDWHITWIIWPIAAVVNTLFKNLWGSHK